MRLSLLSLPFLLIACTAAPPAKEDSQPPLTDDADKDGYSEEDGDCNDADADFSPGVIDSCDGQDNDCDGLIDDEALTTFYADTDGDGYGDAGAPVEACNQPADAVSNSQDCDDAHDTVFPGAPEVCDELDNNCNGIVDDGAGGVVWYPDLDGDGWGDPAGATISCEPIDGMVPATGDCDDGAAGVHPGATEVCDELDNDCDGQVDNDAVDPYTFYADFDGDRYGDSDESIDACALPDGYVPDSDDCDDSDDTVYPGAPEYCDGIDNDCDRTIDETPVDATIWHADGDQDGYGNAGRSYQSCDAPPGYVADGTDCDDGDAAVYPGAVEYCDGADNDCDGSTDEGSVGLPWYADADGDGYGDAGSLLSSCTQPAGYVADATDCQDGDAAVYPGAPEYCDSLDNDCDGATDDNAVDMIAFYPDLDGDGYGDDSAAALLSCGQSGYVDNNSDCDDADPFTSTGCDPFTGFDGTTGTAWEQRTDVPNGLYGMSLITYQATDIPYIYNMYGSNVLRYDTATDTWTTLATPISFASSWANFSPWDGYLWGIRAGNVWRFDPLTETMTAMASVNQTEDVPATETDEDGNVYGYSGDGNIIIYDSMTGAVSYVATGLGSQYETRLAYDPTTRNLYFGAFFGASLYAYNLDSGAVSLATTIPEVALNDIVCSDRSGHIYAAGDFSGSTFYQYTTATNTWRRIPDFPVDHGNNGSCTVSAEGWLYASAGAPGNLYRIALY